MDFRKKKQQIASLIRKRTKWSSVMEYVRSLIREERNTTDPVTYHSFSFENDEDDIYE